jgi:hypothetical protein
MLPLPNQRKSNPTTQAAQGLFEAEDLAMHDAISPRQQP